MSEILVIGHRNPDTDAICSAIGYAEFKRLMGCDNVIAARCGDINDRIAFVLRTFGMAPPRFVADVSPKVRDVMQHHVASISPDATAAEALAMMEKGNLRVLPIVNEDRFCHGLLSVFKLGKFLLPAYDRDNSSRRVMASIRSLSRNLDAKLLFGVYVDREEDLVLMVGAMSHTSFAERLPGYPREKLIVVVGDRQDVQRLAIEQRVRVVIVTGDLEVDPEIVALAQENEVSLLVSPHDSATTVLLCRSAIGVGHIKDEHFLSFREDESLKAIHDMAVSSDFQAFPVLDAYQRVVGILSKTDLLKRVDRKLILVDHNELNQAVKGADQVEIIEIIDHHRIGAFTSHQPMLFMNRPVGSTSTIVADLFFTYGLEMSKEIGGLLLAGLVSDTYNLTSPTTTEVDATILSRLANLTGIDPNQFTEQLFASGSVLVGRPASEAITADCKEYTEVGKKFSVAQIEEIGFNRFWENRQAVGNALEAYRAKNSYFFSTLLITDVVRQTSLLLIAGDSDYCDWIHHPEVDDGVYELPGVVSRKKQLLPYLVHCLEHVVMGSKSLLAGKTGEQILNLDIEPVTGTAKGTSYWLAAVEDNGIHEILNRRQEMFEALGEIVADQDVKVAALLLSEQDGEQSVLLVAGDETPFARMEFAKLGDHVFNLPIELGTKLALSKSVEAH